MIIDADFLVFSEASDLKLLFLCSFYMSKMCIFDSGLQKGSIGFYWF